MYDLPPSLRPCSHFWVVVVRLQGRKPPAYLTDSPIFRFPDNTSFTTYSSRLPADSPYIVTEMSADTYLHSRRFFVLGDEASSWPLNDFPSLYRNGPLDGRSSYTAFVWAFVDFIPPQSTGVRK